jgi:hypothetical protein
MSMHIKMKDEYTQVTTYHGKLDDKYPFIVEVSYGSSWDAINNNYISSVEFVAADNLYSSKSKKYWRKAEDKVRDFVTKWLFTKEEKDE